MGHKSHYVITRSDKGTPIQSPLKPWVRDNLERLPEKFYEDDDTSHNLRRKLRHLGWHMNITSNSVFVVQPDKNGSFDYADDFIEETVEEDEDAELDITEEATEITFSLEKDLQKALRENIQSLERGLKIIDDGKEKSTIAGRIDITAIDSSNMCVVIELKAIEAKSDVIAQILAYMEAVKQESKEECRGIIIASGFSDRVKLAAKQIPSLRLVEYSFQFSFKAL